MFGFRHIFFPLVAISLLLFLVLGVLRWLHVDLGNYLDWMFGLGAFWWLTVVITVPWNIYFEARELLRELAVSRQKGIPTKTTDEAYLQKSARAYLLIALGAHAVSALILAALSYFEISAIGYVGAIVALLLTLLRPILRLHQYIVNRLRAIRQEIHYPREDLYQVLEQLQQNTNRLENQQEELKQIWQQLNREEVGSFAQQVEKKIAENERQLSTLLVQVKQLDNQNQVEHDQLKKHAENAIAQLSEDARFLNQARELVRFIKNA